MNRRSYLNQRSYMNQRINKFKEALPPYAIPSRPRAQQASGPSIQELSELVQNLETRSAKLDKFQELSELVQNLEARLAKLDEYVGLPSWWYQPS